MLQQGEALTSLMPADRADFRLPRNTGKLQQDIFSKVPLPNNSKPTEAVLAVTADFARKAKNLGQLFRAVQDMNQRWAEERFRLMREASEVWSLDEMVVDVDRKVVGGPWSSYYSYTEGKYLPPDLNTLFQLILRRGELVFPLTPARRTTLFWLHDGSGKVEDTLRRIYGEDLDIEPYPINEKVAASGEMRGLVRMSRVKPDVVTPQALGQSEILMGALGFWKHAHMEPTRYVPRVYMARQNPRLLPHTTVISSLKKGQVILEGGLPMDEKHKGIKVITPDYATGKRDFIAAVLNLATDQFKYPLVLRYQTPRPWFGELPDRDREN